MKKLFFRTTFIILSLVTVNALVTFPIVAQGNEPVVFNTQSLKYHCAQCPWALKCTKNCITISKEEDVKKGGIPCKVCGGTCKK